MLKDSMAIKLFCETMRTRRAKLKISQEELAHRVKCHPNHIGRIERGLVDPSFTSIISIARALKISPKDLMPEV